MQSLRQSALVRWRAAGTTVFFLGLLIVARLVSVRHPVQAAQSGSAGTATNSFSADKFVESVKFLSSDMLKGRGNGSPELDQAAQYIADHFRADGLKPGGDDGTYLQHFQVTVGAKLGTNDSLTVRRHDASTPLQLGEDYVPLTFSHAGRLESQVVFAGYGITAPEYHYDDYKGLDAKDKLAVVLRHEPQENDDKSVFAGKQLTTHSQIVNKAINARNHGAAGIILVNDTANHPGEPDQLIKFGELA